MDIGMKTPDGDFTLRAAALIIRRQCYASIQKIGYIEQSREGVAIKN